MTQELATVDTFGIGVNEDEEHSLIATFFMGNDMFGVDALKVQEIVRFQKMTQVPHAPDYILGLINLRGQIVTSIDLRYRLTGEHMEVSEECMNLILKTADGTYSVLVDDVGDVLDIEQNQQEPPPETMAPKMKKYVESICKLEKKLLNILDTDRIVGVENES